MNEYDLYLTKKDGTYTCHRCGEESFTHTCRSCREHEDREWRERERLDAMMDNEYLQMLDLNTKAAPKPAPAPKPVTRLIRWQREAA